MEIRRSAPSVDEAVQAALKDLGASEADVEVTVLREPKGGILGIGSQNAEVSVRRKRVEVSEDELDEQADIAADFLEGLVEKMGLQADVSTAYEDGTMYVDILGEGPDDEDMGLLIGRHGQTLESLQEIARVVVAQRTGMRPRIVVDVEDYKRRQRSRLQDHAREIAERVARSGREEELEPMNPYDRKVVHDVVADVAGVTSESRGEDLDRRVVIRPA